MKKRDRRKKRKVKGGIKARGKAAWRTRGQETAGPFGMQFDEADEIHSKPARAHAALSARRPSVYAECTLRVDPFCAVKNNK